MPDRRKQIVLGDDAVAVLHQMNKDIKDLRLHRNQIRVVSKFAAVEVERIATEEKLHSRLAKPDVGAYIVLFEVDCPKHLAPATALVVGVPSGWLAGCRRRGRGRLETRADLRLERSAPSSVEDLRRIFFQLIAESVRVIVHPSQ